MSNKIKTTWPQYYNHNMSQVFIVNYESLKKYFIKSIKIPEGKKLRLNHIEFNENIKYFKSVIIDESHRLKNGAAQQTKFAMGVCRGKEMVLLLTGTPVINKPKDLISQLHIMGHLDQSFGSYKNFKTRYCSGPREASNLKELNHKLKSSCFFRRAKTDVLKDLPAKMRQIVSCEISNQDEYNDAENNLLQYLIRYKNADTEKLARAMRAEIMVSIGILKNISARGKLDGVYDYIDDVMESGEKLIIFVNLREIGQAIHQRYPDAVTVTGMDDQTSRQRAVESFQNKPDCKLIICSIKAAGVGLTLTASSRVAFVELPWTAADCEQCEDRAHRIGQKDSVQCTYFLGRNTIDEKIYEIIETKRGIAGQITGSTDDIETNMINDIMNLFNK